MQQPVNIITPSQLVADFESLGIKAGMTLLVHSSLKSVGEVCGGPVAVILALEELLTTEGTLVMPTFNTNLTDPARWQMPPIYPEQIPSVLAEMPVFDVNLTPTRKMGCVSETFRKQEGVIRSPHPHLSFAAWGKNAEYLCNEHHFKFGLSYESPLGRIHELGGHVLLLGVDHDRNTSLHLAEYSARPSRNIVLEKAPIFANGKRQWIEFEELDFDDSDFLQIGKSFEKKSDHFRNGKIGNADAKLMSQRHLVEFARTYMSQLVDS